MSLVDAGHSSPSGTEGRFLYKLFNAIPESVLKQEVLLKTMAKGMGIESLLTNLHALYSLREGKEAITLPLIVTPDPNLTLFEDGSYDGGRETNAYRE